MKRTVEYLGKTEDGFAEYEISESYEDDATATVYQSEKIPRPKKAQAELTSKKGILKLNKEEFFKTEFGMELKKALHALEDSYLLRRNYLAMGNHVKLDQNEYVFHNLIDYLKLYMSEIKECYGIEYTIIGTDDCFGMCTLDYSDWLYKTELKMDGKELKIINRPYYTVDVSEAEEKTSKKPSTFKEAYKTYVDYFDEVPNFGKLGKLYKAYQQSWREFENFKEYLTFAISTERTEIMKLNKEEFFKTEFGIELKNTIELLEHAIKMQKKCSNKGDWDGFYLHSQRIEELDSRCEVFKLAIKQFYGIEYQFRRTDDYYGFCTKDISDWLFKVERKMDGKGE